MITVNEALELLKAGPDGVREWNSRRKNEEDVVADLSREDFSGADLSGANLSHLNFKNAYFTEAILTRAQLGFACLKEANMKGACLREADLKHAELANVNLTGADLSGANLSYTDLGGAILEGVKLEGADLQGARIIDSSLKGTSLKGVRFGDTVIASNLAEATHHDEASHQTRSHVTFDAVEDFNGNIPKGFLSRVGCNERIVSSLSQLSDSHQEQPDYRPDESSQNLCTIVLFTANPAGTVQLALDKEAREIEKKIREAEYRDTLKLFSKWAVRPDDLLLALNHHKPHIVHFSGHGTASEELMLLDAQGQPKGVTKGALSHLFRTLKDNIRLVILNACFSQPQAEVIVEHIDCAVGMSKEIGDDAAIAFAASLYRAIGFGRSVQEAFDQGLVSLLMEGIPEEKTPQLLTRDGVDASQVFLVDAV